MIDYSDLLGRLKAWERMTQVGGSYQISCTYGLSATAIENLTREVREWKALAHTERSHYNRVNAQLTDTKATLGEAVGVIQKFANESKYDELSAELLKSVSLEDARDWMIECARAFLAKQEARHD